MIPQDTLNIIEQEADDITEKGKAAWNRMYNVYDMLDAMATGNTRPINSLTNRDFDHWIALYKPKTTLNPKPQTNE